MNQNSCNIEDKESKCCSQTNTNEKDFATHWNDIFLNTDEQKLGWYEVDVSPTIGLIKITHLNKSANILNVGAGSTTLVDDLLALDFSNITANDISSTALNKLEKRVGKEKVNLLEADLTKPNQFETIKEVDLWIDRAVLHFLVQKEDQDTYFQLLNRKLKAGGFVFLAEFSLEGASSCAGLPVKQYSLGILIEKLGENYKLVESFNYTYKKPSGAERPFIYTLFQKKDN